MSRREIPVCGLAAVQALYSKNPDAIRRLFFDYHTGRKVAKISSHLARLKRVYRVVEPQELEKIAGTVHHGGIVAIVEQEPLRSPTQADIRAWAAAGAPLVLLDRVGNPHNLGAIVRTAAFFGVGHVIVADSPQQAKASESAHRVAEGGMVHVELLTVPDMAAFCRGLAAFYHVVGTAVVGAMPLQKALKQVQAAPAKPVALVMGNEEAGLAPAVAAACSMRVTIPGTGKVESLNVSAATAILCWEFCVRNR